jgi:hypothetical protein
MTEAEWLACTDPRRMLDYVEVYHRVARTRNGRRKLRLFACACCRRLWHLPDNEHGKPVVEVLERFADGLVGWDDVLGAIEAEKAAMAALELGWAKEWRRVRLWQAVERAARYRPQDATDKHSLFLYRYLGGNGDEGPGALCCLIREVFGNPFRPASLDPVWLAWHGGLLVSMARRMYESRDFTDMPVLADAVEEAGCTDADILGHLRGPGPHVRGCWPIDLCLGKS